MSRMEPVVCLSLYYKSSRDLLKTNQTSRETQLIAKILWPVLLVPTFTSNNSFLNFWTKFTEKGISCLKQKKINKHQCQIFHVQIDLGIQFQTEQTILFFWTKLPQTEYIWSKTEKEIISNEFYIFDLVFQNQFSDQKGNFNILN